MSLEVMPGAESLAPAVGTAVGVAGLGYALPAGVVSTDEVAARVGVEPTWITRRTGIEQRPRVTAEERLDTLAAAAGRAALADAGVDAAEVDLVLVATCTADEVMPNAAALVAGELGCAGAMAWDVGLACTGWLAAVITAAGLLETGRARCALVIGAETLSRITDHDDKKTAGLFGDGAGAVVLKPGGKAALRGTVLHVDATDAQSLRVDVHERMVRMDGQLVFQRAIAGMESCCREVLAEAQITLDDVALVVPHQANRRITTALAERLNIDLARVADTIDHHGNTAAASVPLALGEVGMPDSGYVLLTAFGSGFAAAAVLLEVTA
ncbi:MAG TPA: beta-ketoacyl-ACP synthase 3 [Solirubrobacteraceae bacterium]